MPESSPSRLRLLLTLLLLTIIAGVAFHFLNPIARRLNADEYAADADTFLARGDAANAIAMVEEALRLRPKDIRYLRLAARCYAIERNPIGLNYYREIVRRPDASDVDRYSLVEYSLVLKRYPLANTYLQPLLKRNPSPARADLAAALIAEEHGDHEKAIAYARSAVEKQPLERDYRLILARLLFNSRDDELAQEGKRMLMAIASQGPYNRLPAIKLLAQGKLTREELDLLVRWMRHTSYASAGYFEVADMLVRRDKSVLPSVATAAVIRFHDGDAEERARLGQWLNRHELYTEAASLVSAERDSRQRDLIAVLLNAYAGMHRWQDVSDLLSRTNLTIDKPHRRALEAMVATNLVAAP